jgi:acyl dehydratase
MALDEQTPFARAITRWKGRPYSDYEPGRVFVHHWGRTINEGDNALFTTLTLSYNPLYYNAPYARAHDHKNVVVNPLLVFNTVFGLSVEDLSEGSRPFLGVEALTFHAPVYPGDTLTARSTVIERRESAKNPGMGIVTWHSEGFNQDGVRVIDFRRMNLVKQQETGQ